MGITELLKHVGDENVTVQSLPQSISNIRTSSKGAQVTFWTDANMAMNNDMMALVIYFPKSKMPKEQS